MQLACKFQEGRDQVCVMHPAFPTPSPKGRSMIGCWRNTIMHVESDVSFQPQNFRVCHPLCFLSCSPAAKGNLSEHKRLCLGLLLPPLPARTSSLLLSPPLLLVREQEMGRDQRTDPWCSFAYELLPAQLYVRAGSQPWRKTLQFYINNGCN